MSYRPSGSIGVTIMRHGWHGRGRGHGHEAWRELAAEFLAARRGRGGPGRDDEEGGGHGHGRWGGWGRGGGRALGHGDLRSLVLALIGEKPRHGYELIRAIEEKFAGAYAPSPGAIYPLLTML